MLMLRLDEFAATEETVDWRKRSNLFTLEVIGDIAMSKRMGFLEAGEGKGVVEVRKCLQAVNRAVEPLVWSKRCYSLLKPMMRFVPGYREQWILADKWKDLVASIVDERLARDAEGERLDYLFACLLYGPSGERIGLGREELLAETSHLCKYSASGRGCYN